MRKNVILLALICLLFAFQSVFAQTYDAPKPNNVYYDGTVHYLLTPGNTRGVETLHFWYQNPYTGEWSENPENIPGGQYPGEYTVKWTMINGDQNPNEIPESELHYEEETVTITLEDSDVPEPKQDLLYKSNDKQFLVDTKDAVCENNVCRIPVYNDIYYFRLCPSTATCPSVPWDAMVPSASGVRAYRIEYLIGSPAQTPESEEADGYIWAEIKYQASDPSQIPTSEPEDPEPVTPDPVNPDPVIPDPRPVRPSGSSGPFYWIGDGSDLFTEGLNLPATGFPTRFNMPLAVQPENISYENLAMRIQIPVINVDVELTGVPEIGDSWAVEWLADRAGLLSRSAIPGEGYAMIAAHNHLNAEEIGPFALLFSLEENDRIFINTPEGGLQIYSVYANELLEPDDVKAMASIAQKESNSLILVTCENEMVSGGYMNRRAIFAKPVASL